MLGKKKMVSLKKLAKKVKGSVGGTEHDQSLLLKGYDDEECDESPSSNTTPNGFFALYVGEEQKRHVVPTSYLSHPLFKILLEKASNEFGFAQRNCLVVPCSVSTFQEVVNAIECNNGKFDLAKIFEDFIV